MTFPGTLSRTATGDVVPPAAERARPRAVDRDPVIAWAGTAAVTLLAAFLRLWNLDDPKAFLFDETYYAKDAWSLVHHGYVTGYVSDANDKILSGNLHGLWTSDPSMVVHPEVGKYLIGLAELVAGMTPFGWRLASAIVGSLMVLVMIRLTRRITGSTLLGLVAGLLMCFDGLQLVLSRLALLDIFVAFFTLCALSCVVADRDWFRARLSRAQRPLTGVGPRLWWRPWLLAAGVFWGLALGTKWAAVYPWVAFGVFVLVWCSGARRSFGVRTGLVRAVVVIVSFLRSPLARRRIGPDAVWLRAALTDLVPIAAYLVVLPLLVYLASWTGWLLHASVYEQHLSHTQYGPYWGSYIEHDAHGFFPELWQSLRSLWHYHHDVYTFHTKFLNHSTHVYQSNPLGWLVLNRPVGVDAQLNIAAGAQGCTATGSETCLRQVLLLGTPALWWFSTIALIWSAVCWVGKRDWRYGIVVVGALVTWLPWVRYDDRPIFSYYAIVIEPFLILGATLLLGEILGRAPAGSTRRTVGAAAAGAVVLAVIVNFAWFWPIYTDGLLTQSQWIERIWFHRWI
ncbi:phospholipid carrier-dependent glycosyltransferase [Nocardioides pocheonensis]|uniref:Polyprenol-phosphate-mannose--protein mannosyltransferase n=1 Tax=Nocardioides pocheonensis TaxID=661485 RepID=A0A3N0GHF7_9ACTN|nr:phospholipid carrier-dependent glycosyltransferase [Nocardioides pocheonensis]